MKKSFKWQIQARNKRERKKREKAVKLELFHSRKGGKKEDREKIIVNVK